MHCRLHHKEQVPCCCYRHGSRHQVPIPYESLHAPPLVQHRLPQKSCARQLDPDPVRLLVPGLRSGLGCCPQTRPSPRSPGQAASDRRPSAEQLTPSANPLFLEQVPVALLAAVVGQLLYQLHARLLTPGRPPLHAVAAFYDAASLMAKVSLALDPMPHPLLAYPYQIDASCFVRFHRFDPLLSAHGSTLYHRKCMLLETLVPL